MGTHGRSRMVRKLLGSVARRVLQPAPCSLLAVKDEDLIESLPCDCAGGHRRVAVVGGSVRSCNDQPAAGARVRLVGKVLKANTSLGCAGSAYDPAKVEDQVQLPARTFDAGARRHGDCLGHRRP